MAIIEQIPTMKQYEKDVAVVAVVVARLVPIAVEPEKLPVQAVPAKVMSRAQLAEVADG